MRIRDVIHGSIQVDPHELPIIDSKYFQRLRQIKQVGFAENSFPSATHNRLSHSFGAMETATRVFDRLFPETRVQETVHQAPALSTSGRRKFRVAVRLASLLHDLGHGPLSHTTEFAMPRLDALTLPAQISGPQKQPPGHPPGKATHEHLTLKMILDSGLTPLLKAAGKPFGVLPIHIAGLIEPRLKLSRSFFQESHFDFRPVLSQIISSELDADRMDYLRRDSWHTGVSYGQFDFNWILENLTYHAWNKRCYLCLEHRALYTFEDFLISRFHMFLMVYFHHKTVIYDEMLKQYLSSPGCTYQLPAEIEDYCLFNDAHLVAHLADSTNEWAQRITHKRPYQMLIELHSGIPVNRTTQAHSQKLLEQIRRELRQKKIHSLMITSTSELSKYFRTLRDPIFIRYDNRYSKPKYIPLEQCTDLFLRTQKKRSVTRLYVSPEDYGKLRGT